MSVASSPGWPPTGRANPVDRRSHLANRSATASAASSSATTTMRLAAVNSKVSPGSASWDTGAGMIAWATAGGVSPAARLAVVVMAIIVAATEVASTNRRPAFRRPSASRGSRRERPRRAERVGFEPTDHLAAVNALAGRPIRPLWHLSRVAGVYRPTVCPPTAWRAGCRPRVEDCHFFTNVAI